MNLGKKKQNPEPVRPAQVRRLVTLLDAENDAILCDAPGTTYYAKARAVLGAAARNSTDAELRAARQVVANRGRS